MQLSYLIWYFLSYAILGYFIEVLYCSIGQHHLVNRGFLHGPYLPIYGFGALLVVFVFTAYSDDPGTLFLVAFFGTSVLEYITSYLLENLFHVRLWDYSTYPFNLRGRVCLLNSTLFGLLSVFVVYLVHPLVSHLLMAINTTVIDFGAKAIILILSVDATSSVLKMHAFQKQISEFRTKRKELEHRMHVLYEYTENKALEGIRVKLDTELEELKMRLNRSAKRMLDIWPSLTSANEERRLLLESLRQTISENRLKARIEKLRKKKEDTDESKN